MRKIFRSHFFRNRIVSGRGVPSYLDILTTKCPNVIYIYLISSSLHSLATRCPNISSLLWWGARIHYFLIAYSVCWLKKYWLKISNICHFWLVRKKKWHKHACRCVLDTWKVSEWGRSNFLWWIWDWGYAKLFIPEHGAVTETICRKTLFLCINWQL